MGDSSKAFEEFIYKRCEEILSEDEDANNANNRVYALGQKLKGNLNPELYQTFLEYEKEITESAARNEFKIYKQAIRDHISLF